MKYSTVVFEIVLILVQFYQVKAHGFQDAVGYHPMVVKPFWFFQNSSSVFIGKCL